MRNPLFTAVTSITFQFLACLPSRYASLTRTIMSTPWKTAAAKSIGVDPGMANQLGFHNLPFLAHRKSVKKGFEFTLMVVGTCNCVFEAS